MEMKSRYRAGAGDAITIIFKNNVGETTQKGIYTGPENGNGTGQCEFIGFGLFKGSVSNYLPDGYGILRLCDGTIREGIWNNGVLDEKTLVDFVNEYEQKGQKELIRLIEQRLKELREQTGQAERISQMEKRLAGERCTMEQVEQKFREERWLKEQVRQVDMLEKQRNNNTDTNSRPSSPSASLISSFYCITQESPPPFRVPVLYLHHHFQLMF